MVRYDAKGVCLSFGSEEEGNLAMVPGGRVVEEEGGCTGLSDMHTYNKDAVDGVQWRSTWA